MGDPRTDEELLAAVNGEPEAFGVFYGRHEGVTATNAAGSAVASSRTVRVR